MSPWRRFRGCGSSGDQGPLAVRRARSVFGRPTSAAARSGGESRWVTLTPGQEGSRRGAAAGAAVDRAELPRLGGPVGNVHMAATVSPYRRPNSTPLAELTRARADAFSQVTQAIGSYEGGMQTIPFDFARRRSPVRFRVGSTALTSGNTVRLWLQDAHDGGWGAPGHCGVLIGRSGPSINLTLQGGGRELAPAGTRVRSAP